MIHLFASCAIYLCLTQTAAELPVQPGQVTFAEAVREGCANNTNVRLAELAIEQTRAGFAQARSTSLPRLDGTVGYSLLDHDRMLGTRVLTNRNQLAGDLTASVPVFAPVAWSDWRHARNKVGVAQYQKHAIRRSVAIGVARAYLNVLTQTRLVEVEGRAVETDRAHFAYAKARYDAGVGNLLDELRADQELGKSQAQLARARYSATQAKEMLGLLLGRQAPVDVADDMPLKLPYSANDALRTARELRPDLQLVRAQLTLAEQVHADTLREFLPKLAVSFDGFYRNPPTPTAPRLGWQMQLVLSYPLFESGLRTGLFQERRSQAHASALNRSEVRRQVESQLRLAYEAVRDTEDALSASRRAAQRAEHALQLANQAYRAGTTGNLEVIDAQRVSRDAQTDAIMAEDAVKQAHIDVLTAAGKFPE